MSLRTFVLLTLAVATGACSQQDKKPRLPENAVVGVWRSDTLRGRPDSVARVYTLRLTPNGMAEFVRVRAGGDTTTERGTWDGADSLLRIVVRSSAGAGRPSSLLFAIHRNELGLVRFDPAVWGDQGLVLTRSAAP